MSAWLSLLAGCHAPPVAPAPAVPPRIGLTGAPLRLPEVLERYGAIPVSLWPDGREADAVLDEIDALVLGPGADLDPALYGQLPHETVVQIPLDRQQQDLALAAEAVRRDLPLLGVCLGAQELAVALGGSLVQDIPSAVVGSLDHRAPHPIAAVPGTPLAGWLGPEAVQVTSRHHQAADRLPEPLVVAARAPDGVVEALYDPDRTWVVGVQYHPEEDEGEIHAPMWRSLVEAARTYAARSTRSATTAR